MQCRRGVVALLVALVLPLAPAGAQSADSVSSSDGRGHGALAPNAPNPFRGETIIPFVVGSDGCVSATKHVVTLRIYNVLSQLVAVPRLVADSAADSTAASPALASLALACGAYRARWDGRHQHSHAPAAPGVYMYQLVVDGRTVSTRKMMIARDR